MAQHPAADAQLSVRITESVLERRRFGYLSILDTIALFRGYPAAIRTDQEPEFTCIAFGQRTYEHGVELHLIQPGKPTQNGFIENFNGHFRNECLNEHWFSDIVHVGKSLMTGSRIITSAFHIRR